MSAAREATDLYEDPAYKGPEAAHILAMPVSTLRAWCFGQKRPSLDPQRWYVALIAPADAKHKLLSFNNLCELYTLATIRRHFHVPMPAVREAIAYLSTKLRTPRPLLSTDFLTNGVHLFVEHAGLVVNASMRGQVEFLKNDLSRIGRDASGKAVRLFPSTRLAPGAEEGPRAVVIDPRVSFGRPVLVQAEVRTEVIQDRFVAGDSPKEMANDFGVDETVILEALRFEQRQAA